MPTPTLAHVISLEGPQALAFAHNQFTSAVAALPNGQWQFSSWLDAQGRVRALFHLLRIDDETLLIVLRGGNASAFATALQRFVFRSRVTLRVKENLNITRGEAWPMHVAEFASNVIRIGCGAYCMHIADTVSVDDSWKIEQVRDGWPWLPDDALNEYTPPTLSLHRLGAIALDKGCYPGQEIVARLHYRGGNKRHLHRIALSTHVANGALLKRDDREFAQLLDVISDNERIEALAVLTDDIARNMTEHSASTTDEGVAITVLNAWED